MFHRRARELRAHAARLACVVTLVSLLAAPGVATAADDSLPIAPDAVETAAVAEPTPSATSPTVSAEEAGSDAQQATTDFAVSSSSESETEVSGAAEPGAGLLPFATPAAADIALLSMPVAGRPYLAFTVTDSAGNIVGGASVNVQGPRSGDTSTNQDRWGAPFTVTDCASEPVDCPSTSMDQDSRPGYFAVDRKAAVASPSNTQLIQSGLRYRIGASAVAPAGYTWTTGAATGTTDNSANWVSTVASAGTNASTINTAQSGQWVNNGTNQVLSFADGPVLQSNLPVCSAGYVYGILDNGQLRQVSPDGTVTNAGSATTSTGFNGLGIGAGGSLVYAYVRNFDTDQAAIWKYNTVTGVWATTGVSVNSNTNNRTVAFVAGAVSPQDGRYYFGGFSAAGTAFRLWSYNPATPTAAAVYLGQITTGTTTFQSNGDIAFDAVGNLILLRNALDSGSARNSQSFTVSVAALAAASGGNIPASSTNPFTTTVNVNGIAFDASGKAYLGTSGAVYSYDTPNWSNQQTVTTALGASTDLASCSTPPVVAVEKYVDGARVAATDQFTMSLRQGTTVLGQATTTGQSSGLQDVRLGPLPTVRGVALTFTETAAGTTDLSRYASSWRCLVDGVQTTGGTGTTGTITIPASGMSVECRFYNSPLTATVAIQKQVTDFAGANPTPRASWTVGATVTPTTGSATANPASTTQSTNSAGVATWTVQFGTTASRATAAVSEQQQAGYAFVSGQCVITRLDGTTSTTVLPSAAATPVSNIAPGDRVLCTYVNRPLAGSITVTKTDAADGTPLSGAQFQLWFDVNGDGQLNPSIDTATGTVQTTSASGQIVWGDLAWGRYLIEERVAPPGYQLTTPAVRAVEVTATSRALQVTFANPRIGGTVSWSKVDAATPSSVLRGSTWKLVGPSPASTEVVVTDCVAASTAACTGPDRDNRAGHFSVTGLAWGSYQLIEAKAPAGYVLDTTPHSFAIAATALNASVGQIVNEQQAVPNLPLTGGVGRDWFLLGGVGVLVAALGILFWRRRRSRIST